ncbi:MAG: serine hydrolase domain-containing protein, partial [Bacteroidales bacterium]
MKKSVLYVAIVAMSIMVISMGFMPNPAKKCEKEIAKIMKDLDAVGLSVAVVKDNHIIYNKSFGYKNLETKEPLTNDCIFRIASISKSFSVTSIMQLR